MSSSIDSPSTQLVGRAQDLSARALSTIRGWLASRHAASIVIALSVIVSLPVLWLYLDADDYFQVLYLEHEPGLLGLSRKPWDLFSYAQSRELNLTLRDQGIWPWWSSPGALISFFRPLTSLTRWLDHLLWPRAVPLMQLHSVLWFGALISVVARVYRQLVPATLGAHGALAKERASTWVATLALALFAFDEARVGTVGWLCNRNALVALAFGFAALSAHHELRSRGERVVGWLGPLWLALALLGGETALQVVGYLLAYALYLDPGSRRERCVSLLPYVPVLLAWAVLYAVLGYGSRGSGFYLDPLHSPGTYLSFLPERLLIYTLALFAGVSADWFNLLPLFHISARPYLLPLAVVLAVALIAALRPLYLRDRHVRFWALGALLAAFPVCAVSPSDRMLTGSGLGGMALLAMFLGSLVDRTYPRPRRWVVLFASILTVCNVLIPLGVRPKLLTMFDDFDELLAHADESIPRTPEVTQQTVVLLNPPFDTFGIFFPLYRAWHGLPQPKSFRWLAIGVCDLRITRVDERSFKLAPSDGFLSNSSQLMLRSLDDVMPVGSRVDLGDVSIEVLSLTADARPAEILARFSRPLESASFLWLRWQEHAYEPLALPAVGESLVLPAIDMETALTVPP